uniref:RSF1_0 protein n=1 Tax=Fopius arisanus TaxID=64838 RepID=A0A0C9PW04_9HYME
MASDNEASCVSDPNFAVICSFLEFFGKSCGISYPDIAKLQSMLEDNHDVPQPLIDLHIKLLRKTRKSVSAEKWEKALVKFCHTYSNQDGWEVERFGYKKVRTAVKVRLLKVLLESQFDLNQRFKNEINKLSANELRLEPLGRDKTGQSYWFQLDDGCNMRVYREDLDEESWELVAKDRKGLMNLISTLADGEAAPVPINEDSNSLEISEKPITDTGQVTSPSLDSPENDSTSPALQPPPENLQESEESSEASELTRDSSNLSQEDSQDSDVPPPPKKPPLSPNPIQKPSIPSPKAPEVKTILKSIETPVITTSPPKPHHPQEQKPLLNDRLEPLHPRKLHQELQKPPKVPCTLSRLQLEKPGASKLEKIAENLARTSGISMTNGDEPQDFRARGMDLSTSPRGWESSNDRPVDFSGMDLSKSSFRNDFQAREIDLSTRKSKESYDRPILRATMMDLSKRPVFTGYESYHNPGRPKEEHRLPNYSILPDPSKLSSMRMKRGHDEEQRASDPQEMVKRLRGDLIPRKGRREEVGAAIEEPLMMVQGEGSGSECEAGRPPQDDEVGEAIEETFFFQGEGNGVDCDTGNPGDETSSDNKESNESKDNCGDVKKHEEVGIKSLVNDCDEGNCQGSSASSKVKFKPTLGVQVFTKSPGSTSKRLSRWDVRETEEKRECDSSIVEDNISVFSGNDLNSTSIREGDISSTTNQNSISSSRISEPTTGEASVADDDDAPRFFFGPNCVSYTSEAATKCPGDDVTGIVSRSEVRGCDPEGEESGGTSASPESSEIKELIVSSENPEPSISDNPESSLVIKSSDDLVTNSSGSRVESTDPESSEVVSTVYDDDKSTGTAEEPQTTSTTTGDFITPEDKDDEVDSTEAESMLPESSGPIINSNDEEELSPGGAATVAPAPIVDGNALKSPERINIALAETSEAKNTDADDNRSVSLDQDSNEAMVIDDRESDSNESTKEISDEGKCGNPEKIEGSGFKEGVAADRFGDVSDDLLPSQEDISPTKEEERELDEALESIETDSKVKGEKINSTIDEIDPKTETSGEAQPEIEESEVVDEFCSMSKEPEETAAENEEIPDIEKNSSRTERDDVEAKKTEEISPEIKDNPLVLEEYSPERENIEPQVHKLEDISKIEQNPEIVEEISQELSEKPQDESPQNPEPEISEEKPSEAVSSTSEEDPVEVPEEIPLETVSKPPERSPESPESPTTPQDLAISAPEDVPLESPLAAPDTQLRTKPSLLSQASLVANYGSDDSNLIGSDDVFDVTPPESEEPETTPEVTQNVLEEFPSVSEVPPVLPDIQSVPQDPEVLPEVSQFPCEIQEAVPDVPDVESPPRVPEEPPEELKSIQSSSETPPEVEFTPEVPPEVPGPVETTPELVEPVPEVQTHPEEPQQPEIIANPTPVDLSANLARETPENQTERPVFSPEEIPLDEKPFDSPDMFDSSKPETPIEIDNQDIEKIAATLNQDDDDDDEEPPELQIEEKMSSSSPEDMETPQEVTEPTNEPPPSLPEEEPAVNPPENPPVLQEMEPEVSSKLQDPEEKSPEASTPPELEAEKSESSPAPELSPEIPEKSEIPRESEVKIQEKIDESPVLQEQIFESRVITMNDHQRKELESDEETSPIRQLSKRPRTETELSTKNETLQKPLELLQVEHNSLQELKPERNILETLKTSPKPIFEELKPQIILNVSQDKSDVKKEASKRLHLEQDPEDLPPIKSSKEDFKDVNDVERPSDIKTEIPNNLEQKPEVLEECKPQEINNPLKMSDDSEDSMGIDNECIYEPQLNNVEPLEELSKSEVESSKVGVIKVKEVSELQYDNWKLDSTEPQVLQTPQPLQKPSRKRRNSAQESNPEDGLPEETDDAGGKRIKLRGKRSPDINLRKSVEASRGDLSSDDECQPLSEVLKEVNRKAEDADVKPKGKKGRKRKGFRGKARPPKKDPSETPGESLDTPKKEETTPIQKKRKKRKMVLGLEIGIDIVEADPQQNPGEAPVRQSRRIAQIKIKEEADRRRIEEETLENMKSKKDKESDKNKKKRKKDKDSDEEVRIREVDRFLKDKDKDKDKSKKKRKKRKKKEAMMRFNEAKPWQSSSGSSSDTEDHEEEEEEEEEESVFWVPVKKSLPRSSSLISMMTNSGRSPSISPIRVQRRVRNFQWNAGDTWGSSYQRTKRQLHPRLFRIDESGVVDSGYSDRSERSSATDAGVSWSDFESVQSPSDIESFSGTICRTRS